MDDDEYEYSDDEPFEYIEVPDTRLEERPHRGRLRAVFGLACLIAALVVSRMTPKVAILVPVFVLVGAFFTLTVVAEVFLDR